MTNHKKHRKQVVLKRKSSFKPPFYINKNQKFEVIRKRMSMKADGPTLNEMSSLDTTGNVVGEDMPRMPKERPISTQNKFLQWWGDSGKQILIGVAVAILIFIFGNLVYHHNIHLTEHDKDIEYLQKNDLKQDDEINNVKEKANEMKTDIRLIEQRLDFETNKTSQSQENRKPDLSNSNNVKK